MQNFYNLYVAPNLGVLIVGVLVSVLSIFLTYRFLNPNAFEQKRRHFNKLDRLKNCLERYAYRYNNPGYYVALEFYIVCLSVSAYTLLIGIVFVWFGIRVDTVDLSKADDPATRQYVIDTLGSLMGMVPSISFFFVVTFAVPVVRLTRVVFFPWYENRMKRRIADLERVSD